MTDGFLIVDKPAGVTSHDVVARCRRIFGQKRVGHGGTLDPDATGVLVVALGRATRLLRFLSELPKSYTAEVVLGTATTTLDAAGEVTGRWDMSGVSLDQARQAAAQLTGEIQQVPPMVSAVKVGGRRLYELARAGLEVPRQARTVTVLRFDVDWVAAVAGQPAVAEGPVLAIAVECSSGTYVRTLAADLGQALGGGAHLRRLRRVAVGQWDESAAVALDDAGPAHIVAPSEALVWLECARANAEMVSDVAHGKVLTIESLGVSGSGPWPVIGPSGELLAVYETHRSSLAKPAVVLSPASSRPEP